MSAWRWIGLGVVIALAVGLYRAKTEAAAARARVDALQTEVAEARRAAQALEAEAARLSAPDRLEIVAGDRLGMRPAEPGQIIRPEDLDRIAPVGAETAP